jgi:hypothetical protein
MTGRRHTAFSRIMRTASSIGASGETVLTPRPLA